MAQPPPPAGPGPGAAARPPLVTAAAIVLFVAGGLAILGGLLLFGAVGLGGTLVIILALINIVVGAVSIWAGVQIMALREQGRMLGLIISGIGALFSLIAMIAYQNFFQILGLLLYGFVIYALVTNAAAFRR